MHISPCCYTCLRCRQDRIRPIDFGDGDLCKLCEAFALISDDDLRQIVNGSQAALAKYKLSAISVLEIGLDADIELSRRARTRLLETERAQRDRCLVCGESPCTAPFGHPVGG
jgi:hypothetical protein